MPNDPKQQEYEVLRKEINDMFRQYLKERNDHVAEVALDKLLTKLYPTIYKVLRNRTGQASKPGWPPYAEDTEAAMVFDMALESILMQLFRAYKKEIVIDDILAFTKQLTEQAFSHYLAGKNPARRRLRERLVYLLKNDPRFHLTKDQKSQIGAIAKYQSQSILEQGSPSKNWQRLLADPSGETQKLLPDVTLTEEKALAIIVAKLLVWLEHPVRLMPFLTLLMKIQNIQEVVVGTPDPVNSPEPESSEDVIVQEPDSSLTPEETILSEAHVKLVWGCVGHLSEAQRRALLLGAQDPNGESALELVRHHKLATWQEITAILNFELSYFITDIKPKLVMSDKEIANIQNTTENTIRVQRSNSRKKLLECFSKHIIA